MFKYLTLLLLVLLFTSCEYDPSKFPILNSWNSDQSTTTDSKEKKNVGENEQQADADYTVTNDLIMDQKPFQYYANFYGQDGAANYLPKPFPKVDDYLEQITDPPKQKCRDIDYPTHSNDMPQVDSSIQVAQGTDKADTLKWITDNLRGGTYKFQRAPGPLKAVDHLDICRSFNAVLDGTNVHTPQAGHCSSASFLGVIIMLKKHHPEVLKEHENDFRCKETPSSWKGCIYGSAYTLFANNYNAWVKKYLGKQNLKWVRRDDMDSYADKGYPETGDSVVINRSSSGHSVLFSHYNKDSQGRVTEICYWSSNSDPYDRYKHEDGMGMRCEKKSRIKSLSIGRI